MRKRAQVSTEYLVILAVVLVIALVVVYLISQSTGLGAGTLETQSQAYWRAVQPLATIGFKASTTTLSLEVISNAQDVITLTKITGSGLTDYTTSTIFSPGQTRTIAITLNTSCGTVGTRYTYSNLTFTYTSGGILAKTFVGQRPLVGSCS